MQKTERYAKIDDMQEMLAIRQHHCDSPTPNPIALPSTVLFVEDDP